MADNDESDRGSDHREPETVVERAASAGVDEVERVLREGGATRTPPMREPHRYRQPDVREMKPAQIEAQRRLVRASLLRRPI